MTQDLRNELERVVKAAQREALTDAFNMLIEKSNRIDKVLFNPTGESIRDFTYGPKYNEMSDKWHRLLNKSMAYISAASAMSKLKENYY